MSKQEKGIQYLKVNLVILKSKNNTTRKELGMGLGGQKIRNYDCWAEEIDIVNGNEVGVWALFGVTKGLWEGVAEEGLVRVL